MWEEISNVNIHKRETKNRYSKRTIENDPSTIALIRSSDAERTLSWISIVKLANRSEKNQLAKDETVGVVVVVFVEPTQK